MTRSFTGMKLKHIATVMDSLVGLVQKDDFPLTELVLSENKLKNDIHDFINALGSNQSLQKLGKHTYITYIHTYSSANQTSINFPSFHNCRYKRKFNG